MQWHESVYEFFFPCNVSATLLACTSINYDDIISSSWCVVYTILLYIGRSFYTVNDENCYTVLDEYSCLRLVKLP